MLTQLAESFDVDHTTSKLGTFESISNDSKARTLDAIPDEADGRNVKWRLFTCEQLLQRQKRKGVLHRIVICDEMWIHYYNPKRRRSWDKSSHASTYLTKPNIHYSKLLLCVWWDQLGVVYYELLKRNETITGAHHRLQLMRLNRALKKKRPLYE